MHTSIVDTPSSTRKTHRASGIRRCARQRRGNPVVLGMKVHIGVDAESGLAHTLETTAASVSDVVVVHALVVHALGRVASHDPKAQGDRLACFCSGKFPSRVGTSHQWISLPNCSNLPLTCPLDSQSDTSVSIRTPNAHILGLSTCAPSSTIRCSVSATTSVKRSVSDKKQSAALNGVLRKIPLKFSR